MGRSSYSGLYFLTGKKGSSPVGWGMLEHAVSPGPVVTKAADGVGAGCAGQHPWGPLQVSPVVQVSERRCGDSGPTSSGQGLAVSVHVPGCRILPWVYTEQGRPVMSFRPAAGTVPPGARAPLMHTACEST